MENKEVAINFGTENIHILDINQMQQAERCIIKLVLSKHFNRETKKLILKKQGSEIAEIKKEQSYLQLRDDS